MRFTIVVVVITIVLIERGGRNGPRKAILQRLHRVARDTYPASTAARSAWYRGVSLRLGWLLTMLTS